MAVDDRSPPSRGAFAFAVACCSAAEQDSLAWQSKSASGAAGGSVHAAGETVHVGSLPQGGSGLEAWLAVSFMGDSLKAEQEANAASPKSAGRPRRGPPSHEDRAGSTAQC